MGINKIIVNKIHDKTMNRDIVNNILGIDSLLII